jgi:hypothetical protein
MPSSYDFCVQCVAGEIPENPCSLSSTDWIRPLMERYISAVDTLRQIAVSEQEFHDSPTIAAKALANIGESVKGDA